MFKIIESTAMIEQFRFPKSRKKRIRKKWAKRPQNWRPDLKKTYVMGDTVICHPILAAKLRAHLANTKPRNDHNEH
jgi:hypothetical protein